MRFVPSGAKLFYWPKPSTNKKVNNMPIFNGTLFQIDQKEMMRYAGLPPKSKEFPDSEIRAAINEAAALSLPRGIWQLLPYDPEKGIIESEESMTLMGNAIKKHLSKSYSVAVLSVTAGEDIEKASDDHFKKGEYVRGLLLDAAATAITEHLADQLDDYIKKDAFRTGQKTTWRFSPGYGDWPVTQQPALCRLIHAEEIGVHVTDHSMLTPRKSVTAIIGLSACTQAPAPKKCSSCRLITCPFRTKAEDHH